MDEQIERLHHLQRSGPHTPRGRRRRAVLSSGGSESALRRELRYSERVRLSHGLTLDLPRVTELDDGEHPSPSEAVAALQALTDGTPHLVSHGTAAVLHGMQDWPPLPPFTISSPPGLGPLRRSGVVDGRRASLRDEDVWEVGSLRLTSPARTWVDCAEELSVVESLVMADRAIRVPSPRWEGRSEPIATVEELLEALEARKGRRGVKTAREALLLARLGSDSPQETRLRFALWQAGLPEPAVNEWVLNSWGDRVYKPDLSFPEFRVGIQYEGEVHSGAKRVRKDVRRGEVAASLGWIEVRITGDHARSSWRAAVRKIVDALYSRGWNPPTR